MKKWIIRILGIVAVLIVGFVLYVEINKEKIVEKGIEGLSKTIDGAISYDEVGVSLLSTFPNLGISFEGLTIKSNHSQSPLRLAEILELSLSVDVLSALRSNEPITVKYVDIESAEIILEKYVDGSTNYDIYRADSESSSESYSIDIQGIKLENSSITYIDHVDNDKYVLNDLNHVGEVQYREDKITIESISEANFLAVEGKVLPVVEVDIRLNSAITYLTQEQRMQLHKGELILNDLPVNLDGNIDLDSDLTYDFNFSSPSSEMKQLISLLPVYYKNEYSTLISKGSYVLKGRISGNGTDLYPKYDVRLSAKDGSLSYPNLNSQVERVSFDLNANNTNAKTLYSVVQIQDLDLVIGQSTIKGDLSAEPSGQAHKTEYNLVFDIDLDDIERSVVLTETAELSGTIEGQLNSGATIAKSSDNTSISNEIFDAQVDVENIIYESGQTSFSITEGTIRGDINAIEYQLKDIDYKSGLALNEITGSLNDPLKIVHNADHLTTGELSIVAEKIDLDNLSSDEDAAFIQYDIPNVDIESMITIAELTRQGYVLNDISAQGKVSNVSTRATFEIGAFQGGSFEGDVDIENVLGFGLNNDTLRGAVKILTEQLSLDPFLITEQSPKLDSLEAELLPGNLDLDIDFEAQEVSFKNIAIAKSLGQIGIRDREILFKNEGDLFGGKVVFSGSFDAKDDEWYGLALNLNIDDLQFKETASTIKLFSEFIPIAKFLEGNYSGTLKWDSKLDKTYIPDLNSLSAFGEIETEDGRVNGLLPIDSFLRSIIQVEEKEVLQISDTKKYFLVEDGKVVVKKIELEKGGIDISMTGTHSFEQHLDYEITIDVPKSKLKFDELIDLVQDKVNFGDQFKKATDEVMVQLVVDMKGSIIRPKFNLKKINLKKGNIVENIQDQAIETLEEARDSVKQVINDTIESTREDIQSRIDSTKDEILYKIDSTKEEISDQVDSTIASLEDIISSEKEDLKQEGGAILDSIKAGNFDSVLVKFEDLFGKKQSTLDSLRKTIPIDIFKKKNGGNED